MLLVIELIVRTHQGSGKEVSIKYTLYIKQIYEIVVLVTEKPMNMVTSYCNQISGGRHQTHTVYRCKFNYNCTYTCTLLTSSG